MGFLDELSTVLVTAAVGTTADILLGSKRSIPSGDGPYISIRETGGTAPEFVQDVATPNCVYPAAQVVVTAKEYDTARAKAIAVRNALVVIRNTTVGGVRYLSIRPLQEPFDMGLDDTGNRVRVGFNLIAMKAPS
jgi:hypothetical protein